MGKRIIQQRRGRGTTTYRTPKHKFRGAAKLFPLMKENFETKVIDLITSRAHSCPIMKIKKANGELMLSIAPEGIKVGDIISNDINNVKVGSVIKLKDIPKGQFIHNIEINPGDGGKFCRASGTFARVTAKLKDKIVIQLSSKKEKSFHPDCRAAIGIVAGAGRTEKPFLKAGNKFYKMKAKNKLWPIVSGASMNAVDHPFGCGRSSRKSKARPCKRSTPPGRKVGMIAPKRTGRKKK